MLGASGTCLARTEAKRRQSKGEFNSVAQINGGLENMINWEGKDKDLLALIKYAVEEDKLAKKWKAVHARISAGCLEGLDLIVYKWSIIQS